uniref:Uncharacterized protein n=1 Tax=Daphnia galeata TaxID=27404 RepID=A0A8J2RQN7_9CRUS|nr:unnamed protein product [Daphnia galeata]
MPLDAQMTRRVTKIVLHSHYNAVTIMSNNDCRALQDIGKYVTNTTTCVNSDAAFTCIHSNYYFVICLDFNSKLRGATQVLSDNLGHYRFESGPRIRSNRLTESWFLIH